MKNAIDFEAKVIANKLEDLAKMKPVPQEYGLPIYGSNTVLGFPVETINNALQKHIKILRKSHWTKHKKQHCWSAYTHNNQILYCITALVGKKFIPVVLMKMTTVSSVITTSTLPLLFLNPNG